MQGEEIRAAQAAFSLPDPRELNPLQLAYVGDTLHDLYVRSLLISRKMSVGSMHKQAVQMVSAAARAAKVLGYHRIVTYILDTENGSSLKAAGYTCEGRAGGLEWNGAKAPKQADQYPRQMKTRWVKKKEGLHGS